VQVKREDLLEPVSGFEPLTCRLQEVRPRAPMPASCTDDTDHRTDSTLRWDYQATRSTNRSTTRGGASGFPARGSRPVCRRSEGSGIGGRAKSYENELASGVSDVLAEIEQQADPPDVAGRTQDLLCRA